MPTPNPALWRSMLTYLQQHHGELCRQWFHELEALDLDGGLLQIRAANQVQQSYLAGRCAKAFNDAAQAATGALVAVAFVNGDGRPRKANGKSAARPAREDFADQIQLSPDYTFDNFVRGPGNELAYAAAVAVADQPAKAYNPLFIHGGVGLGKTHLLQAICQMMLARRSEARICYLSCESFMNQFIEAVQEGRMMGFRHLYRHVDMLVIDDIHCLANKERSQEEFFHTFNALHQEGKQIVLSSDSPPNEIPQLEERLVSRFNWGLVARIDKPCYETRVAIVKKKVAVRGLAMPEDVAGYIASRIESNTRELEGAITKIQWLASLDGAPISLELARKALGDTDVPATPQLSIQTIVDVGTDFFGVKLSDLQSKRRHRSITVPRQICMFLARKRTAYSLEEIGGYFGGRDHTTVMHAISTVQKRINADPQFAAQVSQIDRQLASS